MDYNNMVSDLLEKLQRIHKLRPHIAVIEFLRGEMHVLCYIALQNQEVLPGHISHEMNVSSARIAKALNNLESKGLVTRKIDEYDRRKIRVAITEEGREIVANIYDSTVKQTAEILQMLGEEDAKEYLRLTAKLADIAHNYDWKFEIAQKKS